MVGILLLRKNPAAFLDPRFARAVIAFLKMAVRKSNKARV
jgi:ABC-type phosphate/phosphonate transport system ATPase subunit